VWNKIYTCMIVVEMWKKKCLFIDLLIGPSSKCYEQTSTIWYSYDHVSSYRAAMVKSA